MEKDIRAYNAAYPNCQTQQRQRRSQKWEYTHLITDLFIQSFQRWDIDLIDLLPKTGNGNRWIIMAIDHVAGWPLAKAISEMMEGAIADFIFHEIYIHDESCRRYSQMMKRICEEEWFSLIWRRLQLIKQFPFYLLYGQYPHLFGDVNKVLSSEATPADHEERLHLVQSARQEAARATYERALQAKRAFDEIVKSHDLQVGQWILIWHENPRKFESKWYGSYQIIEKMLLGTYRLPWSEQEWTRDTDPW